MEIKKDINNIHDKSYKDLLSDKEVFVDLISNFIDAKWGKNIQPQDLALVNKSFILADYEELESDIVYRVKNGDEEIYFYVVLELQSTVDYSMPIRLYFYITEIYREIIRNVNKNTVKGKEFKLPAVVPIVLYNGENKWTAEKEFKNIIHSNKSFGNNIVNFEYLLLDVNRYNKEALMNIGTISAAIFMLDQKVDYLEFVNRLKEIVLSFNKLTENDKMRLRHWIRNVIDEEYKEKFNIEEIIVTNKEEVLKMTSNISRTLREEYEKAKREGMEKGLEQGIEKGIESILVKQLIKKFGAISDNYIKKIEGLNTEKLEMLALSIFDLDKVEDLDKYLN